MKKSNIIIFVIIILVIIAIFGYAIWDANKSLNQIGSTNTEQVQEDTNLIIRDPAENNVEQNNISNNVNSNQIGTNNNGTTTNNANYVGEWFISQEAYNNAQVIDDLMDRREDNLITDEEFERQINSDINTNIVELDVEEYSQNMIRFDFKLTSPAPTQREADLDDITVNLTDNVGTFTYTDNWGTSGNGTITLEENKITLRLETTSAAQGALWGVEGIYNFSYKR